MIGKNLALFTVLTAANLAVAAVTGAIGGAGENYIKPVAQWASAALTAYGLDPTELNLIGHSWGAYVAAELAELQPAAGNLPAGKVNSIVALDPAMDYPGGSYNPTTKNEVNFARNSRISWAFYAYGGLYGSATTAGTAHESIVVTASDHSKLVNDNRCEPRDDQLRPAHVRRGEHPGWPRCWPPSSRGPRPSRRRCGKPRRRPA